MVTRPTRAESISPKEKQGEIFSDFLNSFAKTPIGEQLGRVTNEKSVNQSLRNLIKTNVGERLFQPFIGSDVNASLFELNTQAKINDLEFFIRTTIQNNEPRVNLIEVLVESSLDSGTTQINRLIDTYEIVITIVYTLINNIEEIVLTIPLLKRVR
jgi:phage baseplate assembly protein W|tara:strand:+ start:2368 stop:2835 length:468 start_codon:yes stop_codon:yes gene_type:complete